MPNKQRKIPIAEINVVVITAVVYYLYFGIAFNGGGLIPTGASDWSGFFAAIVPSAEAWLVFGDLVLVPMTYGLQAYWLVDHFRDPLPLYIGGVLLLGIAGFVIFVDANLQKGRFRRDPRGCVIWGKPARYLETQRATRLLIPQVY